MANDPHNFTTKNTPKWLLENLIHGKSLIPWIEVGNMLGNIVHPLVPNLASNIVNINKLVFVMSKIFRVTKPYVECMCSWVHNDIGQIPCK
jgi:hypothetical protein